MTNPRAQARQAQCARQQLTAASAKTSCASLSSRKLQRAVHKRICSRGSCLPDAQDCGDLPLGASKEQRDNSYECARQALSDRRAFHMFWHLQGTDSVQHSGIIGRFEGYKRELFRLDVDAEWFGIDITGATASWTRCEIPPTSPHCENGPAECLGCIPLDEPLTCACLPEGPRPGGDAGSTVELRCQPFGT